MSLMVVVEQIERKIYFIRGMRVMLDKDLADLYGVKPRRLREQVKRNIKRFPADFMFQLNDSEIDFMVSQNATPSQLIFPRCLILQRLMQPFCVVKVEISF